MIKQLLAVVVLAAACAQAQSAADPTAKPTKGSKELEFFASGGKGASGSTSSTGILSAGVRLGYVLTGEHLSGPLRGTFEYAIEGVPLYLFFQQKTVYGAGFTPLVMKWNFTGAKRVVPFVELSGGVIFTREEVPQGTSTANFISGAAFGVHVPAGRRMVTLAAKYAHVSNAGLAVPNPGINTIQFKLGVTRWWK